jgi:hypothetical protein
MQKRTPEVFQKILVQAAKEGIFPVFDKRAREWFRQKARETHVTAPKIIRERQIVTSAPKPGDCLIFEYQAKWKDRLPYWDRYPAIFLLDVWEAEKKYLGINLHYLPYNLRAKLLDALYSNLRPNDEGYNMIISYRILKAASRYRAFRPCVKQYHFSHIKSRFVKVTPSEWDVALFLPIARWQKQSEAYVWRKSEAIIDRYKPGPGRWMRLARRFLKSKGIL